MHVSVTALGSQADRTSASARDIVAYLEGGAANRLSQAGSVGSLVPPLIGQSGPGSYYADAAERPGIWRGAGAKPLGDSVDPPTLKRVLLGQDPLSGAQLVSAVGSAGRTRHHPRDIPAGDPNELMTLTDAAEVVGVHRTYLWRLAKETAARQPLTASPTAESTPPTDTYDPPTGRRSATYLAASKLDGQWMVTRGEVARFTEARNQPQVVMAYDVTFSAPKSFSILWATGDEPTRRLCEEAFEAGVARGVEYLENNAVWIRRGRDHLPASGMTAASYRHSTNRELEPQLHEHVVIANMGMGPDGRIQALDGRGLFAHATTAGHIAEAEMQNRCNRRGIAWTTTRRGIADVAGVGAKAIRSVSTRREQILSLTSELGADSARARQKASLSTRAAKTNGVDMDDLRDQWRVRLVEAGFGPSELEAATSSEPVRLWTPDDTRRLDRHLAGPVGVTEQQAVFDRRDVIQTIVDLAGGRLSGDEAELQADRWLHTEAVIPLDVQQDIGLPGPIKEGYFTTPTMVRIEQAIADGYQAGHDASSAVVPTDIISAETSRWERSTGRQLGEDQRAMVEAICGSGDRFQAIIGPPGSGKTAALEVAARAWEQAGYKVIGVAVNGTAAEVLQRSTGVESRTVAALVTRLDTASDQVLDSRTVILLDEASTLGNRHHARLVHHIRESGATMRAIGDPAQHSAVEAGGMWARLANAYPDRTPKLSQNRRQAATEMADLRLANADYRAGRITEAINRLEANDRIVTATTSGELLDQLAADWYVDHKTNPTERSRMIAEHHRERRALNVRAQALLKADGSIIGPGVEIGESIYHVGDQIIARTPNRALHPTRDPKAYVRNGTPGTVTAIEGRPGREQLIVDFEHRGPIAVGRDWLTAEIRPGITGGLTPAYAVTSHAAQGDTYRAGRMVATDTAKTEAVYVGLTRGTHETRIYTVAPEPKTIDTDPRLPRIEDRRTEVEALRDQLNKPRPTETVTAQAPDAAAILAQLNRPLVELEASLDPVSVQAAKIIAARISHQARANPDPALIELIGLRNEHHDATAWNTAVDRHALYQARTGNTSIARFAHIQDQDLAAAIRAAEVSRAEGHAVDALAERRHALVSEARRMPGHSPRLARQDNDHAIATVNAASEELARAQTAHGDAAQQRGRRRDPDQVETARRDVEVATNRLSSARQHAAATLARLEHAEQGSTSVDQIEHEVNIIDAALKRRIRTAVDQPADYLTDMLGSRPTGNATRWSRAAEAVETYRHASLGVTPDHGPIDLSAKRPAIGPKPADPLRAEAWSGVARLIDGRSRRRGIDQMHISQ